MSKKIELVSVGISFFRSIGDESIEIDLTKKINLLIGPNNAGKSNVLYGFQWLSENHDNLAKEIPPLARFKRDLNRVRPHVSLTASLSHSDSRIPSRIKIRLVNHPGTEDEIKLASDAEGIDFRAIGGAIFSLSHRSLQDDAVRRVVLRRLAEELLKQIPEILIIPQFRQIENQGKYAESDVGGSGITKLLHSWQHPEIGEEQTRAKFDALQEFVRRLLGDSGCTIEVAHGAESIILNRDGLRLPIESQGAGVHELILIAAAIIRYRGRLICIEEPEIHLHPGLQKELLRFLLEQDDPGFIVTTHSHGLLDLREDIQVTHLRLESGATVPRYVNTTATAVELLRDLGVTPSDILHANSVIWVEGPSDRIYILAWLGVLAPDLKEGTHFAIMFYGGRLLSHLSLERDEESVEDFVRLTRINQAPIVVFDSDRGDENTKLNATKKRIINECKRNQVHCWLTWGREIENYLSGDEVARAYEEHTLLSRGMPIGRFDRLEEVVRGACGDDWRPSWSYSDAKPAWARRIVKYVSEASITRELREEIEAVITVIRMASRATRAE